MGLWWEDDIAAPRLRSTDADMRETVEGAWQLTLIRERETRALTFTIVQGPRVLEQLGAAPPRGLVRSASACPQQRTLVRSASACETTSTMPLDIIAIGDDRPSIDGSLLVIGADWERGKIGRASCRERVGRGEVAGAGRHDR